MKPLASGANGETFVAISKSDVRDIRNNWVGHEHCSSFYDKIRSRHVVAKFDKEDDTDSTDLSKEIDFLSKNFLTPHAEASSSPMTHLIDYCVDGITEWLTLPFITGGYLRAFVKQHKTELSLGLQWHFGLGIAKALAYLHHGVTDLSNLRAVEQWLLVYQGDLHTGNLLLAAPDHDSCGNYPDIVLTDFGSARAFSRTGTLTMAVARRQLFDFRCFGGILAGLLVASKFGKVCARHIHSDPYADCEECLRISKLYGKLDDLTCDERLFWIGHRDFRSLVEVKTGTQRRGACIFWETS